MMTKQRKSKVIAVDILVGDYVTTTEGEILGKLENILLEVSNGRVAYAVLSLEQNNSIGEALCAIPWHALKLDRKGHLTLKVDKKYLEKWPQLNFKDAWPKKVNCNLINEIRS